jgi:hypothetical protein
MSNQASDESRHERPRVVGSFVEPDDVAMPLLVAVGQALFAVAGLEKSLQLELIRLIVAGRPSDAPTRGLSLESLADVERLTAGQLLAQLRTLGLPEDLDGRIGTVIQRRNDLVHHPYEDPDLVRGLAGGEDLRRAVARVEQLAVDAGELAVELQLFVVPKLEKLFGKSRDALIPIVQGLNPETINDARDRRQVEAVQAFLALDDGTLELGCGFPGVPRAETAHPDDPD